MANEAAKASHKNKLNESEEKSANLSKWKQYISDNFSVSTVTSGETQSIRTIQNSFLATFPNSKIERRQAANVLFAMFKPLGMKTIRKVKGIGSIVSLKPKSFKERCLATLKKDKQVFLNILETTHIGEDMLELIVESALRDGNLSFGDLRQAGLNISISQTNSSTDSLPRTFLSCPIPSFQSKLVISKLSRPNKRKRNE